MIDNIKSNVVAMDLRVACAGSIKPILYTRGSTAGDDQRQHLMMTRETIGAQI